MNQAFRISLGLAAIDGLSSAFVATLLLALALIGSGDASPAPDLATSTTIYLTKKSNNGDAMKVELLLAIYDKKGPPLAVVEPLPGAPDSLHPIANATSLTKGGAVFWFDCKSDEPICSSQFLVTKPASKCWVLAIRGATTPGNLADSYPEAIDVHPEIYPKPIHIAPPPVALPLDGPPIFLRITSQGDGTIVDSADACRSWK